jgi:protein arginine N-methyltransferase 3
MLIDNVKEKAASRKEEEQLIGELEYSVPEDNSRALKVAMTWKYDGEEKESSQTWNMK